MNKNKTVIICVNGGIAVYKALDIVSILKKHDIDIYVIMSKAATEFVNPLSFQALSQNAVITDMFEESKVWEIQHISLAKKADLIIVVPATANILGKVANGIADDMISTTIMATKAPVVFAPAMNTNMYNNPIVQNNISKLEEYGYKFILPIEGRLACGDTGEGKLADSKFISNYVISMLYDKKDLIGKKILVTAGPTISPIDPIRYITNRSTGKMGYAIAEECRDRGAKVILISGPTNIEPPFGIITYNVQTNGEMLNEVLNHFEEMDIVIKSAAVADYKASKYSKDKIKKSDDKLQLNFVKDTDILKKLGIIKKSQILVGFAAESSDLLKNAELKLKSKNLDYIVANDIMSTDIGFASDDNKVTIVCRDGQIISLEKMSKKNVARHLMDLITVDCK